MFKQTKIPGSSEDQEKNNPEEGRKKDEVKNGGATKKTDWADL